MLNKIKSKYILSKPFEYISRFKFLNIIKYNKTLQKKVNISINTYIKYFQIEIEITPYQEEIKDNKVFINIMNKKDEKFYHIYFNGKKEEVKRNYIKPNEKVSKIKIIIDKEVKSLENLFGGIDILKTIKFKNFNRTDITNCKSMFDSCSKLINLDITKLKTDNATNMDSMFSLCSFLKKLDLSNFKTDKVENMKEMFWGCKSLKKLDLSNFRTDKVKNMFMMFCECESLKKLDLSNFRTDKVVNMSAMFDNCFSLRELDISNFKFNKNMDTENMFGQCSEDLKDDIRYKFKNLNENAFYDDEEFENEESFDYYENEMEESDEEEI